jgi:asparagine synthase (glutamine-hydrolysing)
MWSDEVARDFNAPYRAVTGIDRRHPLADRRVMEFFGAVPLDQCLKNGQTRSLARRLLSGRIPAAIVDSPAHGIQNGDWHATLTPRRAALQAEIEALRARPAIRRVVDLDRLLAILTDWPADLETAETRRTESFQVLTRGMELARFLAWHDGDNVPLTPEW